MFARVRITDVSPRDGLQNEAAMVPTSDKARLVELLQRTGVDEIEATSFVSARWVPQLGDAEELLKLLRDHPSDTARGPLLSALVPNEQGFERASAFHSAAFPLKVAVFTAASETFSKRNTNATIAETLARFTAFLPRAFDAGMRVRMYVSCVIACPFEGPIEPAAVRRVSEQLLKLAPAWALEKSDGRGPLVELDLGDTIGAGAPGTVNALLTELFDAGIGPERLVMHFHDTFGRAADCVTASLARGVRSFDGSVAGLGGCPYAGTKDKPAPGNISTEDLVRTVHAAGYTTGVDPAALTIAADFARRAVGAARATAP